MSRYHYIVMIAFFVLNTFAVDAHAFSKSTKVTIVVVNEADEPLSGISVGVGFEKNLGWRTESFGQDGITVADGRLSFSGKSNGHVTYGGSKDGYYPSYYYFDFKDSGAFSWAPWNPELKIVMRKIENPVPMYARNVKTSEKKLNCPCLDKR